MTRPYDLTVEEVAACFDECERTPGDFWGDYTRTLNALIESKRRQDGTPTPADPSLGEGELLPCPFCGAIPFFHAERASGSTRLECSGDDCLMEELYTPPGSREFVIAAWNRRAAGKQLTSDTDLCEATPKLTQPIAELIDAAEAVLLDARAPIVGWDRLRDAVDAARATPKPTSEMIEHIKSAADYQNQQGDPAACVDYEDLEILLDTAREQLGQHGVMPASEDITDSVIAQLREEIATCKREGWGNTAVFLSEVVFEIERLRKFEEYDKRLRESARRERERGDGSMGPST